MFSSHCVTNHTSKSHTPLSIMVMVAPKSRSRYTVHTEHDMLSWRRDVTAQLCVFNWLVEHQSHIQTCESEMQ